MSKTTETIISVPADHQRAIEAYASRTGQPPAKVVYQFLHLAMTDAPDDLHDYRPTLTGYIARERARMATYYVELPTAHRENLKATSDWLDVPMDEAGAALVQLGFGIMAADYLRTFKSQIVN